MNRTAPEIKECGIGKRVAAFLVRGTLSVLNLCLSVFIRGYSSSGYSIPVLRRWRDSLRARLLIGSAAATSVVFVVAGVALYLLVRAQLVADLSATLTAQARAITSTLQWSADGSLNSGMIAFSQAGHDGRNAEEADPIRKYMEIWSAGGEVLVRSAALGKADLLKTPQTFASPTTWYVTLPGGQRALAVALTVTPKRRSSTSANTKNALITLAIAHELYPMQDTLGDLWLWLFLIWAAAIVIETAVLAWVVDRGLRYAKVLAGEVAKIKGADLSQRIQLRRAPLELEPIVERVNDLLDRVQTAFAHEKSFLGQVAHELRTPLAGLRSTLEVALSQQRDSEAYREDLHQSLEISQDMQAMVDNLLAMARLDAGQSRAIRERVRVDELLDECREAYLEQAKAKGLTWDWQVESVEAWADSQRLRMVLRNLMDNAVSYAPAGTEIQVICRSGQARTYTEYLSIEMTNEGCQVPASQADCVFDRFWRGDPAGGGDGGHCGLGLALCKQIVEHLNGTIQVRCEQGGGFHVVVTLSAATSAAHETPRFIVPGVDVQ